MNTTGKYANCGDIGQLAESLFWKAADYRQWSPFTP
jgi:hypothetical protein